MTNEVLDEQQTEISDADRREALSAGWTPEDKWKGPAEEWVDVPAFLERARPTIRILKGHKEALEQQVAALNARDSSQTEELHALRASIAAIEEAQSKDVTERAAALREEILSSIEEASEAGEHRKVAKLTGDLSRLDAATEAGKRIPERRAEAAASNPRVHPDFPEWQRANPWYGTERKKTLLANAALLEAKAEDESLEGRDLYDRVDEIMAEKGDGTAARPRGDKVSGGRPSGAGGGSEARKSYSDLPAAARQACENQAKFLVGPGKAHKDLASWKSAYAATYHDQEARRKERLQ